MKSSLKIALFITSTFLYLPCISQNRILYVIDSIVYHEELPFMKAMKDKEIRLKPDEIERTEVLKGYEIMKLHRLSQYDSIVYITTKAYANRPAALKQIPDSKRFFITNGRYYFPNSRTPYSGPYLVTTTSGLLVYQGMMKNGYYRPFACEFNKDNNLIKRGHIYVVDTNPYHFIKEDGEDFYPERIELSEDEVEFAEVITDPESIKTVGFYNLDTIISIKTKYYAKLPQEVTKIPNKKKLHFNNNRYCNPETDSVYNGQFFDTYLNGKISMKGEINNGVICGLVSNYNIGGILHSNVYSKIKQYKNINSTDIKPEVQIDSIISFWANGNTRNITRIFESSTSVEYEDYTSDGKLIEKATIISKSEPSEIYINPTFTFKKKFSRKQKKGYQNYYKLLLNSTNFNNKNTLSLLKQNPKEKKLVNPKSHITFSKLGFDLFLFGETESAIRMLDSALAHEPLDFETRICRLYFRIYKYERNYPISISQFKQSIINPIKYTEEEKKRDYMIICEDIQRLKENGYPQRCYYDFIDVNNNYVRLMINIDMAQTLYRFQTKMAMLE